MTRGLTQRRVYRRVLFCPLLAIGLLFLLLPSPAAAEGKRHALIVGVDHYDDEGLAPLRFAGEDARALSEVLRAEDLGGFDSVTLLEGEAISSKRLRTEMDRFWHQLAPEDLALLYFSGHGTRWIDELNRSQVYLALSDTVKARPRDSALPLLQLQDWLHSLPASRRVLILDACFTGQGKVELEEGAASGGWDFEGKLPFSERVRENEAQIFATTFGRPALESSALGHGLYTFQLLQALGPSTHLADTNRDHVVTVSEAHDYARVRVLEDTQGVQIPMALYRIVGREELVLSGLEKTRERVEVALVSSYERPQEGMRFLVDGMERGTFPSSLVVPAGKHRLEFRNAKDQVVESGRLLLRGGETYNVQRLRDRIVGGRHQIRMGGSYHLIDSWKGTVLNDPLRLAPGLHLGYRYRFASRDPVARHLLLGATAEFAWLGPEGSPGPDGEHPLEALIARLGIGPAAQFSFSAVLLTLQVELELQLRWQESLSGDAADTEGFLAPCLGLDLAIRLNPDLSLVLGYALSGAPQTFRPLSTGPTPTTHRIRLGLQVGI